MSTAVCCAIVCKESWTRVVVAVNLLQENVLARIQENSGIRVVFHGRVPHLETLQVQVLCRNHDGRSVHRSLGSAVAMVRTCGHGQVRAVKNRTFARIGQVVDAVVVALAACREDDCRSHLVPREKDRIAQVIDATANPHCIARVHHGICLVERGEGLVFGTDIAVFTVGRHVVNGTERLHRR